MAASRENTNNLPLIAVIGGGMSGLATVQKLLDLGDCRVILFEAKDYVGGRVHTTNEQNGIPLECGANWIHGTGINDSGIL
jgi:protoporphyrinogen oxidase